MPAANVSVRQKKQFNCRVGVSVEHARCDGNFDCSAGQGALEEANDEGASGKSQNRWQKVEKSEPKEVKSHLSQIACVSGQGNFPPFFACVVFEHFL